MVRLKTGIKFVIVGSIIQMISGFGDSLSHDLFGIDGLNFVVSSTP